LGKIKGNWSGNKMRNIVLMGYRGSGKTSIAKELGKKLNKKVISTDNEIEKKVGNINKYIEKNDWKAFRDIESEIIENINESNLIVDCGGGFIERESNVAKLKEKGIIIWLKASVQTIKGRIKDTKVRPSLTKTKSFIEEIEEVLEKRTPLYKNAADFKVDTENKSIEENVNEIIGLIEND
jgi:shikimate kinase